MPGKLKNIITTGSVIVIAVVLIGVVFSRYPFQAGKDEPIEDENSHEDGPQDQNTPGNITQNEIRILSWDPAWELITCLPRETGETNYDLHGFLNVTVDNPSEDRVRMSLTVRYDYAFNYTLWGEPKIRHNSHKRTVSHTIYEHWERSYEFTLFYQPFDGDSPPNLQMIRFDAEILEVAISN